MSKMNRTLLILLCAQVLMILLLDNPCATGYFRQAPEQGAPLALFPDFDAKEIDSLEIRKGGESVTLRKTDGSAQWTLSVGERRCAADAFAVEALLTTLARLKGADVVSRNPEKASVYGLEGEETLYLTVRRGQGSDPLQLVVGKNLGALRGTYVKIPGADAVYLEMENIRRSLDKGDDWVAAWRDKTVLSCVPDELRYLRITRHGGEIVELVSPEAAEEGKRLWRMVQPLAGTVKAGEWEKMGQALSSLKALDFAERGHTAENLNLLQPALSITVRLASSTGEKEHRLDLTESERGNRYLMVDGDETVLYKVAGYLFNPFLVKAEQLLEEEE